MVKSSVGVVRSPLNMEKREEPGLTALVLLGPYAKIGQFHPASRPPPSDARSGAALVGASHADTSG